MIDDTREVVRGVRKSDAVKPKYQDRVVWLNLGARNIRREPYPWRSQNPFVYGKVPYRKLNHPPLSEDAEIDCFRNTTHSGPALKFAEKLC